MGFSCTVNVRCNGVYSYVITDPLLFYRKIATLSAKSEGDLYLFFEINEAYGSDVCAMLREMGYTDVELKHDMYGKARMVRGRIAH